MYRKFLRLTGLLALPLMLLVGCASAGASESKASLGQEFTLPVGQSVTITGEDMAVKFDGVTTDSRSPSGVQTVWAGEAKIVLQVRVHGKTSTVTLTEKGGTAGYSQDAFSGYTLSFKLMPYPEAGKQPAKSDYTLTMKITK